MRVAVGIKVCHVTPSSSDEGISEVTDWRGTETMAR